MCEKHTTMNTFFHLTFDCQFAIRIQAVLHEHHQLTKTSWGECALWETRMISDALNHHGVPGWPFGSRECLVGLKKRKSSVWAREVCDPWRYHLLLCLWSPNTRRKNKIMVLVTIVRFSPRLCLSLSMKLLKCPGIPSLNGARYTGQKPVNVWAQILKWKKVAISRLI